MGGKASYVKGWKLETSPLFILLIWRGGGLSQHAFVDNLTWSQAFLDDAENDIDIYAHETFPKYFSQVMLTKLNKNFRKFESFQLRYFGTLELGILK